MDAKNREQLIEEFTAMGTPREIIESALNTVQHSVELARTTSPEELHERFMDSFLAMMMQCDEATAPRMLQAAVEIIQSAPVEIISSVGKREGVIR